MMLWVGVLCGSVYLSLQLMKLIGTAIYVHRYRNASQEHSFSDAKTLGDAASSLPVQPSSVASLTILQPILSGDPRLPDALRYNLMSVSESVRFLWLIDESDTTGQQIALQIDPALQWESIHDTEQAGESNKRLRVLLCPASPDAQNPKSFKLHLALPHVSTAMMAILDDDTRIEQDSLNAATKALERFDLYTGLPSYERGVNFWSDCVTSFVNSNAVLTYLPPLVLFAPISLNGMFYVTRTQTVQEMGGFAAILNQLCDDYAVHRLFQRHHKTICQGLSRQRIATTVNGLRHFLRLMHRWNVFALVLTRDQRWFIQCYLASFLGLPSLLFLVSLGCLVLHLSLKSCILIVLLLAMRQAIITLSQWIVFRQRLSMNLLASVLVELLQPLMVLWAVIDPEINWRGRRIKVRRERDYEGMQTL